MVKFLVTLAALAAAAFTDAPRGIEDPRAFVAGVYEAYRANPDAPPADPVHAYSDRLRGLFEAYEAWARGHEDLVGALNFDWWVNAQDWEIGPVSLVQFDAGPDRRVIQASWTNAGRADSTRFFFVRQNGRWYLDEAVNGRRGEGWTLSELLRQRD